MVQSGHLEAAIGVGKRDCTGDKTEYNDKSSPFEAGGIFGELMLVEDSPRSATAVVKTTGQVVRIDEERFTFLIEQTPYFAIQVMRIMADRIRKANALITQQ
jgi:CRP-like cAMP-binding protein